jgi:hypothetical protein
LTIVAGLAIAAIGCVRYDAVVRVAKDGGVQVAEKVIIDPAWREEVQDTLNASKQVIDKYSKEARARGGVVKVFGSDSATAEFRYASLAAFARGWPDSTDDGQAFDRSVYHRLQEEGAALDELILFRMSPPDARTKKQQQGQRQPVLRFAVVPPGTPLRHNAHHVSGDTYWWQFTDAMQKPDSVWIVWPATPAR